MLYEVRSNGGVIGYADLGFPELYHWHRVGSFRPTAAGEPLMERFADITRAHRAYRRNVRPTFDDAGRPILPAVSVGLYADIAAAVQRTEALELQLFTLEGRHIPTEYITIRDLEEVLTFNAMCSDELDDPEPWRASSGGSEDWRSERRDPVADEDEAEEQGWWRYHISVDLARGCDRS